MSRSVDKIPFDDIVAGASARVCVIGDVQYLSIRDVIMHICGLTSKRANEKWSLLSDSIKKEIAEFVGHHKFTDSGTSTPSPVITFKGVLKLIMHLSGDRAAQHRSSMVKILTRYYAGDGTLTDEIEANAKSTSPIQQMAKASIGIEHVPVEERSLEYKRKLQELEISKLDLEIKSAAYEHITKVTTSYRELCKDKDMDASALQILKESLLNKAILEGDHPEAPDDAPPKPERKRQKRKHHVKPSVAQPAYQPLRDVWHLSDFKAFLGDMWEEPEEDDSMMEMPD
jgi:hypothetical protein